MTKEYTLIKENTLSFYIENFTKDLIKEIDYAKKFFKLNNADISWDNLVLKVLERYTDLDICEYDNTNAIIKEILKDTIIYLNDSEYIKDILWALKNRF